MLVTPLAESGHVIHRLLTFAAFVICGMVLLSFAMFARDEVAGASQHQQNELIVSAHAAPLTQVKQHAQPRRFIDGAASTLTKPFSSIVQSDNAWVKQGVPAMIAVLAYGLGLGYLARFSQGLA